MANLTPDSILEKLFKVDPKVARVILVGLGVLAAIAIVGAWQIDPGRILPTFLWLVGAYVVFAFLANMPGWIGALLGGLACFGFAAYLALFSVQLVAQNVLTPPLMAAGCFFNPGVQGCPLNMIPGAERRVSADFGQTAEADATAELVVPAPDAPAPSEGPNDEAVVVPAPDAAAPSGAADDEIDLTAYRVFVQFSPSRLGEDSVEELIGEMISNGWIVAEEAEALPSAFGLNEVRYFHPEDEAAARRLAGAVGRLAPWAGDVRVRDFTRLGDTAPTGLLEVWTSG